MNQILFRKWGRNGLKIGFGLKIAIPWFAGELGGKMDFAHYQMLGEGAVVFAVIVGF
jgi:hypothetical protein